MKNWEDFFAWAIVWGSGPFVFTYLGSVIFGGLPDWEHAATASFWSFAAGLTIFREMKKEEKH